MKKKPKILITNDDGIQARGIYHLWKSLHGKVDLTIVAPARQQSGVGVGLTLHTPITINPVQWKSETPAWEVTGTPADCVRFALRLILKEKPDLIVSGINQGGNSGRNVLYSGTMGGVIEGAFRQIPGIAFSSFDMSAPKFETIEPFIYPIVEHILEHPMERGTVLNVNFPTHLDTPFKGVRLAKQGRGLIVENPQERIHPDGASYYWHGGQWDHHDEHDESDVSLLEQGFIAAVPLHVDELTDHGFFSNRKDHFEKLLNQVSPDSPQ